MRRLVAVAALLGLFALVFGLMGCQSTHPRRDPVGERFPSVVGTSLEGDEVRIPEDFAGAPALLLVGFDMDTQFDLDRWLLGLTDSGVASDIAVREVPTIPGMIPGMFSGKIDAGMRKGIPAEDWGAVVTVYGDGDAIARFLGNDVPLPGRIVLLDASGTVVFFHDDGYSVGTLKRLEAILDTL
jgi:hypothetical protein